MNWETLYCPNPACRLYGVRWRQSLLEELSASGEGMRTYGIASDRARLLEQIEAAKSQLM